MTGRRTAAALAIPLALALAAGCGGEAGPEPRDRLASAEGATLDAGTAAFTMDVRIRTGPDSATRMSMNMGGRGAANLETGASRLEMELGGLGIPLTMLHDGDTVFVRMPGMMTGGDPIWVRRPAGQPVGVGPGAGGFGGGPSPFLAALGEIGGEIERLGADSVRGDPVEGFAFSLPGDRYWQGEGEAPPALAEIEVPTEVWLDGSNRVRRMSVEMDLRAAMTAAREVAGDSLPPQSRQMLEMMGRDASGDIRLTMELFDFGIEVVTRPPDTVEVVDADSLGREMMRMRGGGPGGG